jgi:hypothetical protein
LAGHAPNRAAGAAHPADPLLRRGRRRQPAAPDPVRRRLLLAHGAGAHRTRRPGSATARPFHGRRAPG